MKYDAYELLQEARRLMEERRESEAVDLLERAKSMEPGRGSILEVLGAAYYNCGRHERAMREFEEALDIDPTNHYARYGLSRCYYRMGMLHRALGQVKLAEVMAPEVDMYLKAMRQYRRELRAAGEGVGFGE